MLEKIIIKKFMRNVVTREEKLVNEKTISISDDTPFSATKDTLSVPIDTEDVTFHLIVPKRIRTEVNFECISKNPDNLSQFGEIVHRISLFGGEENDS